MLVFDKKLLKTRRINQVVVPVYENEEKAEGLLGYIYSDLDTYRQATTLLVRFEGEIKSLTSLLGVTQERAKEINFFAEKVPFPFKMFAPYLGLVNSNEKLTEDLEDLIDHLHIIGRTISFSEFVTVPAAARINVSFTKSAFLTMKQEIRDYVTGLYETEKDESPDTVYWVSSEEIERVGRMADAITQAFGAMATKSSNQVADSFAKDAAVVNDVSSAIQKEMADFEDNFDPAEWADFKPMTFASDFGSLGGGDSNSSSTSAATSKPAASSTAASSSATPVASSIHDDDDDDGMDMLMMMSSGVDATNNMIGG